MAQRIPLPFTVSCFSEIQIGFTFLVPAHLGSPGQRAVKWVCVCVHDVPDCLWAILHQPFKSSIISQLKSLQATLQLGLWVAVDVVEHCLLLVTWTVNTVRFEVPLFTTGCRVRRHIFCISFRDRCSNAEVRLCMDKREPTIRRCYSSVTTSFWTSSKSRALVSLCTRTAVTCMWATEGLEASTCQTKDNMAVDGWIRPPACKYWSVQCSLPADEPKTAVCGGNSCKEPHCRPGHTQDDDAQ